MSNLLDTRRRKTYKTNVRIYVAGRIEGYTFITANNTNKIEISKTRRAYMCETMNILKRDTKPSTNYSLQDIWKGSGAR